MNKFIIVLVALVMLVGGFFIFNAYIYNEKQAEGTVTEMPARDIYLSQFEDRSIEMAFDYPGGLDGYVIDDMSDFVDGVAQGIEVVKVYRIINAKEKIELENSEGGREGPPAIQLMVFRNNLNQTARAWVDSNNTFSNIEMIIGVVDSDSLVNGVNAVQYTTDGLYLTDNVAFAHVDYIYHFSAGYLEPSSVIRQDFKAIIDSVRFVSPAGTRIDSDTRINVQVACESALAYTLFQTGEQADQFVAECVAGEHPEVIDRYINDLGMNRETI